MQLTVLPQRLGLLCAAAAFAVAWAIGLLSDVPVHVISLRAVLAASAFMPIGFVAGRLFVNAVCEAMTEELKKSENEERPDSGQ